jgi:drug/metabolite transporter (DMT)-like permease
VKQWWPVAALLACAVSLGSQHVFARVAFAHGVNVLTAATMRSATAALLLLALLLVRGMPLALPRRRLKGIVALGLLIAVQTALLQASVFLLPVAVAILAFYTFPFFTGLASSILGDESWSVRLVGALVAAFAGLALVVGVNPEPVDPLGVAAALGAAAIFTSVLILTPRLAPELGAPLRTFWMLATAVTVFLVVCAASGRFGWPADTAGAVGLAGLSVLYAAGIVGVFLLLPRMGATQTAVVLNLEPVAVAVVAWLALGESLSALQVAGAGIVVAAVIFYQASRGPK